jgi:hypothetical protein
MRIASFAVGILWMQAGTAAAEALPGTCPAEGAEGVAIAVARSDAGDGGAATELDLAACYRVLEQEVPESAALGRALDLGLADPDATLVRTRLDEIGWPPPPVVEDGPAARVAATLENPAAGPDEAMSSDTGAIAAYTLTGISAASLVAATAVGFVALDEESSGGDSLTPGVAAAVCAGVGIAAGIAAILLWPDSEVAPAPAPGDVGVGIAVRF